MTGKMLHIRTLKALLLTLMLCMAGCGTALAQQFSVTKFRVLPNDVSAFITPVRDLNDEACALLKVTATPEYAFSSPLGIVMRKDNVGEIWLYLPKGTKKITIKHPEWGVMRDYKFEKPLESHMTYEMVINSPKPDIALKHDTIVLTKTIVDTIAVKKRRPKLPLRTHALFTVSMHENGPSGGVMVALMRRHGFFVHASADLRSIGKTVTTCDKEGFTDGSSIKPYYTGQTRHSTYTVTAGAIHRLGRMVSLFEGIGYGRTATAWELAESEGGGLALNDGLTHKGLAAELGVVLSFGRISVSASAVTIAGRQWQGCIGVGINIGKR